MEAEKGEALVGEALATALSIKGNNNAWYMGATDHMFNNRLWFDTYSKFQEPLPVRIGNGKRIFAEGSGNINILAFNGTEWKKKYLSNVLHVPELTYNLFSLGATLDKGMTHRLTSKTCEIINEGNVVAMEEKRNRLFCLIKFKVIAGNNEIEANVASRDTLLDWHQRMAHQNQT